MHHIAAAPRLVQAATAAGQHGAGDLLRVVIAVALVGAVLAGWFLLRGYRDQDDGGSARGTADTAPRRDGEGPPRD